MILGVDTSSAMTSVAVVDQGNVIASERHLDSRRHAEVTAPLLRDVLDGLPAGPGSITCIACGVGPGPYTGLRVGIATAKALGLAWDVPVVGLCSLDALAERVLAQGTRPEGFAVAVDARRSEAYWAAYDHAGVRCAGPMVTPLTELAATVTKLGVSAACEVVLGPQEAYPEAEWIARRVERLLASGACIAAVEAPLGDRGSDGSATAAALRGALLLPPSPLYLRRPDAQEPRR